MDQSVDAKSAAHQEPTTLATGYRVLSEQARALAIAASSIDHTFEAAVALLLGCEGRVVVAGMGKSGVVGRKIASTLASTGTRSFFVHPGEASHGDLGMIAPEDVVILVSFSGETDELIRLLPSLKRFGNRTLALVGHLESTLARNVEMALVTPAERETCPHNLAPTTSTTVTMALGDALAIALMEARDFRPEHFAALHPGGSLGWRLLMRVRDAMHTSNLPVVDPDRSLRESLWEMTRGRLGLVLVLADGRPQGLVTDGDLRRALLTDRDALERPISRFMTRQPVTISQDEKLVEAERMMRSGKIKALIATNDHGAVTGILEIFDE